MKRKEISISVGGKTITFETGKVARQANGAVIAKCGDTVVFTSACASKEPNPDIDFFPLRIDYQEKFSSAGKTLGGFIKREGRPREKDILTSRLIDRPLRPMFENGYFNEVQVLSYVWSYDGQTSPEALALCCASAALTISDIPLIKPVGAVRVAHHKGEFVINPPASDLKESKLDLMIAGTEDGVLMIEGYCDFFTEEQVIEAIYKGHTEIKKICAALAQWREEIGKPKKRDNLRVIPQDAIDAVRELIMLDTEKAIRIHGKQDRDEALSGIKKRVKETFFPEKEEPRFSPWTINTAVKKLTAESMRNMVLNEGIRCDGRATDEVRFIDVEMALWPRTHGSALFTRGETQAMAVCTLGGKSMAQRFEDIESEGASPFYLQYSFPPFSVGEVGRMGPPGRREVGHGKLAERALVPVMPTEGDDFPYVIRLESNITESNGSSSMASVCGGCLALMDAGVPIKRPVSGIAMGLIMEGDKYAVLSDISGTEDALGDMDFKITGDAEGITAFQMDIKVEGITPEVMTEALYQAKGGRVHILEKMLEVCPKHNEEMSEFAPRITTIRVKQSKIAVIIGPGGKMIRSIIEETGAEIDINDDGIVNIATTDPVAMDKARQMITDLVAEAEIGKTYDGKVVSVVPFGAFVEILPGKEGLCHISELDHQRVNEVTDVVKEGDKISVKVLDINDRGQIRLSRKALLTRT
jgi:polyribonucleotide nucleotidyltransferase